jgi:hypothetical protein
MIGRWRRFGLIARPLVSEFALAGYSFVRFGDALDPVLKLAASLRQLLGYHVAGADRSPIRETCGERDSLTSAKFVFCHQRPFRRMRVVPARVQKGRAEAYDATDA